MTILAQGRLYASLERHPIVPALQTVVVLASEKQSVVEVVVNGLLELDAYADDFKLLLMGWSFRKSVKFGPLRFNFSKSGVGVSAGVKGARVSYNSRGTYVTLGGNGIYYRERIGSPNSGNFRSSQPSPSPPLESGPAHTLTTADVESVTDVDSKAFIQELESKARKISLFPIFGIIPSVVALLWVGYFLNETVRVEENFKENFKVSKAHVNVRDTPHVDGVVVHKAVLNDELTLLQSDSSGWVRVLVGEAPRVEGFIRSDLGQVTRIQVSRNEIKRSSENSTLPIVLYILVVGVSVAWCFYLLTLDRRRKTLTIHYDMDSEVQGLYYQFQDLFSEFTSSQVIWQNLHSESVSERKYYAGASELVSRAPIKSISKNKVPSRFLKTNVSIPHIGLRNTELYFFPERIVLKRGNKFGSVFYRNLEIRSSNVRFIESDRLPSDAQVVDYTWKYLNKSGGPDRRFKDNRKLPICLYSEYAFESEQGIHEVITTSKTGSMDNFAEFILAIGKLQQKFTVL